MIEELCKLKELLSKQLAHFDELSEAHRITKDYALSEVYNELLKDAMSDINLTEIRIKKLLGTP